jgi:MFS transporter, NNP family, nitrate/nitrite transporter
MPAEEVVPKFTIPVDSEYKSKVLRIWSFQHPHHRSFHINWVSFMISFVATFAPAALLPAIRETLNLNKSDLVNGGIAAVTGTIACRIFMGSFCDAWGPRFGHAFLQLLTSPATFGIALITGYAGYVITRMVIGFSLATFVCCQFWGTVMFNANVVGTANAVAGGWGNMGAGVTYLLMPLLYSGFQNIYPDFIAWRVAFFIPGSLQIIIAIVVLLFAQDLPLGQYSALKKRGKMNKAKSHREFISAVSNYRMWVLTLLYGYCFGVELTVSNILSTYFHDWFRLSTSKAALWGSVFGLTNLFARALGGIGSDIIAKRFGMRGRLWWLYYTQMVGGAFCIVLYYVDGSFDATIAVLFLFALHTFAACGATFGIVPFVSRRALGIVCGFVGAGGNAGSAITQAAFFTPTTFSYQEGFLWMGVMVLVITNLCFTLWWPMWGGMILPAKEDTTEEEYFARDFTAAEKEQGLHRSIMKYANESRSQRGFKSMQRFNSTKQVDGVDAAKQQDAV